MSKYDKASLVHIPSGYKSGTLYNVLPNDADGDFDFTRASTATRVDENGLIETIAIGTPRLNYPLLDGVVQDNPTLLLEPSRTNLLTYSEDFTQGWSLNGVTVLSNNEISPDGSQTADKIVASSSSGDKIAFQSITVASGFAHTASAFFKASEYTYAFLRLGGIIGAPYVIYDLSTQATVSSSGLTSSSITQIGNGWYKIKVTATSTSTSIALNLMVIPSSGYVLGSDNIPEFTGDGTSGGFVWGAQFEAGSYPTSYIKTQGASVTRSADICNGAGTANDFNDSEGVLYYNGALQEGDDEVRQLSISNGTDNENVKILQLNDSTIRLEVKMSAGSNFVEDVLIAAEINNKFAIQYKADDYKVFVNGFKQVVGQRSTTPTGLSNFNFDRGDGASDFYGNTKEIIAFNEALSDTELEALTSYRSFNEMATEQLYTIL